MGLLPEAMLWSGERPEGSLVPEDRITRSAPRGSRRSLPDTQRRRQAPTLQGSSRSPRALRPPCETVRASRKGRQDLSLVASELDSDVQFVPDSRTSHVNVARNGAVRSLGRTERISTLFSSPSATLQCAEDAHSSRAPTRMPSALPRRSSDSVGATTGATPLARASSR